MSQDLVIHKLFSDVVGQFPKEVALQIKTDTAWQRFTYLDLDILSQKVAALRRVLKREILPA